jgi:hypothetical protein
MGYRLVWARSEASELAKRRLARSGAVSANAARMRTLREVRRLVLEDRHLLDIAEGLKDRPQLLISHVHRHLRAWRGAYALRCAAAEAGAGAETDGAETGRR